MIFNEEDLNNLFLQFLNAMGVKGKDLDMSKYLKEFKKWLELVESRTEQYAFLLTELGFDLDSHELAEVGKTGADSIIQNTRGTIITPYSKTFDKVYEDRVINGNMIVLNDEPFFIGKYKGKSIQESIPDKIIHTYMTHNPYNQDSISRWETLHNVNKNDIIVGMYGERFDVDKDKKINQLYQLREKLDDQILEEYVTYGDEYYYIVGSKRKVLSLNYVLSR